MSNIIQTVSKHSDLNGLRNITQPIVGQICWEARLGYAEELVLEIGTKIPYNHPKLQRKMHGSWSLRSRGTKWILTSSDSIVVKEDDEEELIREKISIIKDTIITAFDTKFPSLSLNVTFNNCYNLNIQPEPADDLVDIAYWELFCPPSRYVLEVGPGSIWSYTESGRL